MPSIDTAAAGFHHMSNKTPDNYSYPRVTMRRDGTMTSSCANSSTNNNHNNNGNASTWATDQKSCHNQSTHRNNNRVFGNSGPITTVLAPPKHPCLINLDPFGAGFFQYPLLPGVTMLGSGRGCPKPPDLVLHGTGIQPQHCFIERNPIDDEVILHPISERTTVDDVPICGPTSLVPGNLVTIGGTHTFRFDGPATTTSSATTQNTPPTVAAPTRKTEDESHQDTGILQRLQMLKQQKLQRQQQEQRQQQQHQLQKQQKQTLKYDSEESPYAIINPGAGNPLRSAGDVNKNSLLSMKIIMDPLLTLEQTVSNRTERRPQDGGGGGGSGDGRGGGFDTTPERSFIINVSNGNNNNYGTSNNHSQSNKFIGNDSFVNHQGRELESRRFAMEDSSPSSVCTAPTRLFSECNNNNNNNNNNDSNDCSNGNGLALGNSERQLSSSGVSSCYSIDKNELSKSFDRQDSGRSNYYFCSTPVRYNNSLPSPVSFSPCSSRLASSTDASSRFNDSPDPFTCPTHTNADGQYLREEAIACETLLELKRKQAHEARLVADMTERSEKLRLEEILAMCAEYEEQIAREIRENTPPNMQQGQSGRFTVPTSNGVNQPSRPFSAPDNNDKLMETASSPKSPTLYGYSRIKTNGSLPRDKKPTTPSESSKCPSSSSAIADDEIASIFTFSPTIGIPNDVFLPSNSIPSPITTAVCQQRPDQFDSSSGPSKVTLRTNIKSPYENIGSTNGNVEDQPNPPQSPRTRIRTTLGRVPNDAANGSCIRRPIITTVVDSQENKSSPPSAVAAEVGKSPTDRLRGKSPTKSKLTVTFSNSVQDIHEDSETGRRDLKSDSPAKGLEIKAVPGVTHVIATQVEVHVEEEAEVKIGSDSHANMSSIPNGTSETRHMHSIFGRSTSSSSPDSSKSESSRIYPVVINESRAEVLKKNISEVEQQEMEALREMEIEKALLLGEENSLETQLATRTKESKELKAKLEKMDEGNRQWRGQSLEHIATLKAKLTANEKELERLEKIQDNFQGDTDEETSLLEQLKHQHELVEIDRKAFEDAEFYHMEEEINREGQRDELSKIVSELDRKVLAGRAELEQLQSQNRISFGSSAKEVQKLEQKRQEFIQELRQLRESIRLNDNLLQIPDPTESFSDSEYTRNPELDEKLRSVFMFSSSTDTIHIERIKSRSPIDPMMRTIGAKTCETLREIERNREYLLNEQGVQMLEQERQRVRELQKRVQDAVREEWEATRKTRNNQCHSLNSVGSEDSTQTISDTPTDSGSGDDTTDTSGAPSVSTTDMSLNNMSGGVSTEKFEQMRQKQRDMSEAYEETRPLSDGSAYDNGSSIVTMREKHRVQSRPLTRYLPVRGDEERFDLRAFIESSGHQLELCPHIIVTGTTARGFLSKLGSRFNNWVKRWFVFDRETRTFSYYIDKSEKKPRGGIHFQAIEEVYVDHLQSVKSPQPKLTFCVKTSSRVFHLMAPSPEAMRMWVDIIFTGAEGYQEFKAGSS